LWRWLWCRLDGLRLRRGDRLELGADGVQLVADLIERVG
jgi:hypothetical protein